MKIQVTQADIFNGRRKSCSSCPVALAIRKVMSPDFPIEVDTNRISVGLRDYITPNHVATFINAFDLSRQVGPIEFELDIPSV